MDLKAVENVFRAVVLGVVNFSIEHLHEGKEKENKLASTAHILESRIQLVAGYQDTT